MLAGEVEGGDEAMELRRVGIGHLDGGQAVEHGDDDEKLTGVRGQGVLGGQHRIGSGLAGFQEFHGYRHQRGGGSEIDREIDFTEFLLHRFVELIEVDGASDYGEEAAVFLSLRSERLLQGERVFCLHVFTELALAEREHGGI